MQVLHIDDCDTDVWLFSAAARRAGVLVRIHAVSSANDAVRYLEGEGNYRDRIAHPMPDLIVLALALPGLSGYEFLGWHRGSRFSGIPVVVLTGRLEPDIESRALELGAALVVRKPSRIEDLTVVAGKICRLDLRG